MILDCCYTLPERPGVYYFYDNANILLYIGKSKNIRKRVLSHFYRHDETKRHADLIKQTAYIDFTCTAGELGALLLESAEIKKRQPIYNRRLRKHQNLYSWVLNDELKPILHRVDDICDDKMSIGLYRAQASAKQWLLQLIEKNELCAKVLGLESAHRHCCFNYQLKRCRGACCGRETIDSHNHRLMQAFEQYALIAWPWQSAIAIVEEDSLYQCKAFHIINQWRYLGSVADLGDTPVGPLPSFSRDSYQILIRYLQYENPVIIELAQLA
ncbi:excinuclease Cho [Orbus hercynius]|uniref:Excinuclease cho n=1 Tax=Orbus hercynius TaxID=593135 RepID=A0A495RJL9_9GAMM|nr:GIY-YIG nuclease family protein [Orbus hercynius]RKS87559.1 excinuclease Cho [Orbus hercynius]